MERQNMPNIEEILQKATAAGASDIHITVGIPPKMRLNGGLVTLPYESLTAEDTMENERGADAPV